jgi:hypothetical protein
MTAFTFDTAYIVATMQNTCNEAVKAAIRERLDYRNCEFNPGYGGWESFETFCWAWKHDCIEPPRALPVADPCPHLDGDRMLDRDIIVHFD